MKRINQMKMMIIWGALFVLSMSLPLNESNYSLTNAHQKRSHILNNAPLGSVDVINISQPTDWYQTEVGAGQGSWSATSNSVSVDAFDGRYALDGATYLSKKGIAYGAYEFQTTIHISELNDVENPMVGIIPWYVDDDNYMYVQLKFTNASKYQTTPEEVVAGYAIEKILFSGKYNGESKYYTATSQQENTTYDSLALATLGDNKKAPTINTGHTIKVRLENNSATATSYKVAISYNGIEIANSYAYYYNAVAKNLSVGFMAQDVKATFSNAYLNDFLAENNNAALARDWKNDHGFTYRIQNGIDIWDFKSGGHLSFNSEPIKEGNKVVSNYRITGSNIAGYDTNRGFTNNPHKETSGGLPQNYEISASFKRDAAPDFTGTPISQGYGLLAWYKDDLNFVDVTLRINISGNKLSPTIDYELVLFGWIEGSSSTIGSNVYRLPSSFNPDVNHTIKVAKKSTAFYVYLDDNANAILSKNIKGTSLNYYYGYEGFNAQFSASPISASAIYEAYDEIAILDDQGTPWRVSGKSEAVWTFNQGTIAINAKETSSALGSRSYIIGASDISDRNMSLIANVNISLGSDGMSELMLAPYLVDDNNFARIGLVWKNNKVFARLIVSTYTEDDIDEDNDPHVTLLEHEISAINLSNQVILKAEKIETTLSLYVNGTLVYGKEIADIDGVSEDYAVYVYNMNLTMNSLLTDGYKKWSESQVGTWLTTGMKFNAWTITEAGYLAGDATYEPHMIKDNEDANKNMALKVNPLHDNYEMTVDIIATKQSEAQDRVGVVMWYLDEDNFMLYFIDMWRADSTVPRTTVYGKIEGETLPTTYNHGGWLPEGDQIVEGDLTQTEASQVTNWHTIHVRKQGNTFTCSLDDGSGYISYTVAAGLPSTSGKTLYTGAYTYNDAILVRSYDVTTVGGFTSPTLPNPANNPYNEQVSKPTLPSYSDHQFSDEFNQFVSNVDNGNNGGPSSSEIPSSSEPGSSEPTNGKKGGCFGGVYESISIVGFILTILLLLFYRYRKVNKI